MIRAEIRDVDDDEAIKIVNETNIQQRSFEKWRESEKAQSISQYYESIKRQGKRSDLQSETSGESQQKSDDKESRAKTAEIYGVKENIIAKYLKLNKLIVPLKDRLDAKKGDFGSMAATHIAFLSEKNQKTIEAVLKGDNFRLTVEQAKAIKDLEKENDVIEKTTIIEILKKDNDIKTESKSFTIKPDLISKYFQNVKPEQIEAEIIVALEMYLSKNNSAQDQNELP